MATLLTQIPQLTIKQLYEFLSPMTYVANNVGFTIKHQMYFRVIWKCLFHTGSYLNVDRLLFLRTLTGVKHHNDVIINAMASQITSLVYLTVYSGADQRKHQSVAPLAFVRGIHRSPVNSPHKGTVTRKLFPFDDVIMLTFIRVIIWRSLGLVLEQVSLIPAIKGWI